MKCRSFELDLCDVNNPSLFEFGIQIDGAECSAMWSSDGRSILKSLNSN
jgi:hypothetical protein